MRDKILLKREHKQTTPPLPKLSTRLVIHSLLSEERLMSIFGALVFSLELHPWL